MPDFTPIQTQDELDKIISARLEREKTKHAADLAAKDKDITALTSERDKLKSDLASHSSDAATIADLKAKVANYETDSVKRRIAEEYGLPSGFHCRLQGKDETELKADAEALSKLLSAGGSYTPPLADPDPAPNDKSKAQYFDGLAKMLPNTTR